MNYDPAKLGAGKVEFGFGESSHDWINAEAAENAEGRRGSFHERELSNGRVIGTAIDADRH
jgi:hypothetical protein